MADHQTNGTTGLHGVMAEFETPEAILSAARAARAEGYRSMDAYTPFSVNGLAEALGMEKNSVSMVTLLGGLLGGLLAYSMLYYATVIDYPTNIAGRPLHSWPAYIPITFELTVLFASFAALLGMLALNHLPRPYHPVFNTPGFDRATDDRFFLCIEASDEKFDRASVQRFLERQQPVAVEAVRP